jgi:type IX secretion system PorP/SprF family membrane protein
MIRKILVFASLLLVSSSLAFSQQILSYSQYSLNKYLINPAAAGCESYVPIIASYKQYWTGIDGSPTLADVSASGMFSNRAGLGIRGYDYTTGALSKAGMEATYAYHIPLNSNGSNLSFGLSGVLYQEYIDRSKLNLENPNDPLFTNSADREIVPDFNFGLYYYSKRAYVGVAVYSLLGRNVNLEDKNLSNTQQRNIFIIAGYDIPVVNKFSIEPSVFAKMLPTGIYQVDASVKFNYNGLWIGGGYRTNDATYVFIGMKKDNLIFGYSYDMVMSGLSNYTSGSHEIFIGFMINNSKPKLLN